MLSSSVCDDFPIVDTLHEWNRSKEVPKDILILFNIDLSEVWADLNTILHSFVNLKAVNDGLTVPVELSNHNADDLSLVQLLLILAFL